MKMDSEETVRTVQGVLRRGEWRPSEPGKQNDGVLIVWLEPIMLNSVIPADDLLAFVQTRCDQFGAQSAYLTMQKTFEDTRTKKWILPTVFCGGVGPFVFSVGWFEIGQQDWESIT